MTGIVQKDLFGKTLLLRLIALLLVSVGLSSFFGAPQEVWAFQRPKVTSFDSVGGLAVIEDNNIDKALSSAISYGLKNAITRFAESYIGELSFEQEWLIELLIDEHYKKRYIHGYRVLQSEVLDDYYTVTLSVDLFVDPIKKDLVGLEIAAPQVSPKILVLIDEKLSPIYSEENFLTLFSVVEDTILKKLKEDDWDVVGRNAVMEIDGTLNVRDAFSEEIPDAVMLGKALNVDYMFVGTADKADETGEDGAPKPLIDFSYRIISIEDETVEEEERITGYSDSDDSFLARTQSLRTVANAVGVEFSEFLREEFSLEEEVPVPLDAQEQLFPDSEENEEGITLPHEESLEEPPLPDMNTL